MEIVKYIIVAVMVAFLGSIPSGYVLIKLIKQEDIRSQGSGNIGTTNALRAYGPKMGLLTFLMDFFKGFLSCWLASKIIGTDAAVALAGVLSILGHCFSIFLDFNGGKGIATSAGVLAFIDWRILAVLLGVFFLVVIISKYVSLGSILATSAALIAVFVFQLDVAYKIMVFILVPVILYRHKTNIQRLLKGTESKIGQKS